MDSVFSRLSAKKGTTFAPTFNKLLEIMIELDFFPNMLTTLELRGFESKLSLGKLSFIFSRQRYFCSHLDLVKLVSNPTKIPSAQ